MKLNPEINKTKPLTNDWRMPMKLSPEINKTKPLTNDWRMPMKLSPEINKTKPLTNDWRITMKINYRFVLLALIAGVIFWPAQRASAQDTLVVEWWDGENVIVNALRDAIATDTTATGEHVAVSEIPNRVYKLYRGGYYWLEDRIENDGFHLRIVGEEPGTTLLEGPAVIQMVEDADGNVDGRIITGKASVTLKNLWLTGNDDAGVQTYYQPIQMDASNSRFVIENCVLTRTNFAPIAYTGKNNDIFYKDCVFRNLIGRPSTQQWEGRGISIWADQDTVIVENCTFFNVGMTAFQLEGGAANYVGFYHNTLVNVGRGVTSGNWWREAYFANNLIVNGFWHSEGYGDMTDPNRDPRNTTNGMFTIGDLPSMYGPEEGRRFVLANTASWRDPRFAAYYADSLLQQPFLSPVSILDYLDVYDAMVAPNLTWVDPGLATTFDDAQIDSMIQNIEDLRAGVTPATPYFWQLPEYHTMISWPLPEDFTYTNTQLLTAGTDGLPLGDLNWFPDKKAQWEANKAQYIAEIKDLAGEEVILTVVDEAEAEDGTLAGTAAIETFEGFSYFQMDGGGFIEWAFDLATAGQYDLNIWTHMRGNSMRGQRIIVNGVSIHDPKGWGEYIWDTAEGPQAGMEINDWTWTLIIQDEILEAGALTLPAGENTIRIEASWGWQHFAGFDLLEPGTDNVVKSLRAPDVTDYSIVTPIGEGAPWTPSGFKSVAMGASGSIAWNMNAPSDGKYRLTIFYQNYGSPVTGQIQVDGVDAVSVDFDVDTDSLGHDLLSANFDLTGGSHSITLSGSGIKVDYIQLIQEVVSSVRVRNELPRGYALKQNYPNPFNPTTNINFTVGKLSHIELTVYNLLGQKVTTLVDQRMPAGAYRVTWDASNVTSGLYFYTMKVDKYTKTRKMTVIK